MHAYQDRTVEAVIAAIEANHPNLTNRKMLHVKICPARDRAGLVTEDKAGLNEQLEALTDQRITALEARGEIGARDSGTGARREMRTCMDRTPGIEPAKEPKNVGRDLGL